MIEVQIRRSCKRPELNWFSGYWECSDCGAYSPASKADDLQHRSVTEWMPLAEAVRLAHIEEAKGEE